MKNKATERIGEISRNKYGLLMRIIKYYNNKRVVIEFVETGERKTVRYIDFKKGKVAANLLDYPLNNAPSLKAMKIVFGSMVVGVIGIITLIAIAL